MSASRREHDLFFGLRALLVLLLLCGLGVGSASGGTFDGSDPFVVSAAAFNVDGFPGSAYFYSFQGYLYNLAAGTSCFMAPLYLPAGLSLARMVFHAYDSNAGSNIGVALVRSSLFNTAGFETMGSAWTSGSSGMQNLVDDSIQFPVIDNRNYNYRLQTCIDGSAGTSLRIYAVTLLSSFFNDGFESGDTSAWSSTFP